MVVMQRLLRSQACVRRNVVLNLQDVCALWSVYAMLNL